MQDKSGRKKVLTCVCREVATSHPPLYPDLLIYTVEVDQLASDREICDEIRRVRLEEAGIDSEIKLTMAFHGNVDISLDRRQEHVS